MFKILLGLISASVFVNMSASASERCVRCKGSGMVRSTVDCKNCAGRGWFDRVRVTKYRQTFAGTRVRRFSDGNAGTYLAPCEYCNRKGSVTERVPCPECGGMGTTASREVLPRERNSFLQTDRRSVALSRIPEEQPNAPLDPELELAKQRLNTKPFKSYKCKYREGCPHCKKLFEKNQLTKSYCEQCFVCKKKRDAGDDGKQADEIKALEKAVKKAVEAKREEKELFE